MARCSFILDFDVLDDITPVIRDAMCNVMKGNQDFIDSKVVVYDHETTNENGEPVENNDIGIIAGVTELAQNDTLERLANVLHLLVTEFAPNIHVEGDEECDDNYSECDCEHECEECKCNFEKGVEE